MSVHARQQQVAQDQVIALRLRYRKAGRPVRRGIHVIAGLAQDIDQILAQVGLVLDAQNPDRALRHGH
jgi:hypothetical protein